MQQQASHYKSSASLQLPLSYDSPVGQQQPVNDAFPSDVFAPWPGIRAITKGYGGGNNGYNMKQNSAISLQSADSLFKSLDSGLGSTMTTNSAAGFGGIQQQQQPNGHHHHHHGSSNQFEGQQQQHTTVAAGGAWANWNPADFSKASDTQSLRSGGASGLFSPSNQQQEHLKYVAASSPHIHETGGAGVNDDHHHQQQQQQLSCRVPITVGDPPNAHHCQLMYPPDSELFSRKVFVGGLPIDVEEKVISDTFRRFGNLMIDWPRRTESNNPRGYVFLVFEQEAAVQQLVKHCHQEDGRHYIFLSSPMMKNKPVQVRPWRLPDADYARDLSMPCDPRKTVFIGGVPRPIRAVELAAVLDKHYGCVCYAGIDTDPELKYPKGAARVTFSSQASFIRALTDRFVQIRHTEADKRVEIKPYVMDDQLCDECHGNKCNGRYAHLFCSHLECLQYYCDECWTAMHSNRGRHHKPMLKLGQQAKGERTGRVDMTSRGLHDLHHHSSGGGQQQQMGRAAAGRHAGDAPRVMLDTTAMQQQPEPAQQPAAMGGVHTPTIEWLREVQTLSVNEQLRVLIESICQGRLTIPEHIAAHSNAAIQPGGAVAGREDQNCSGGGSGCDRCGPASSNGNGSSNGRVATSGLLKWHKH